MNTMVMRDAVELILGSEVSQALEDACDAWIARFPSAADLLNPHARPPVVPATINPYGRPRLAWIANPGTSGAVIHIPTGHKASVAVWQDGALTSAGREDLGGVLRHELAHHVQRALLTRTGDTKTGNTHFSSSWCRTIATWHQLGEESVERFASQVPVAARRETRITLPPPQGKTRRNFAGGDICASLCTYDFPLDGGLSAALAPFAAFTPETARGGAAVERVCAWCEARFKPKRSDAVVCSPKCRVSRYRAAKGPQA